MKYSNSKSGTSRRDFLRYAGMMAGAAALAQGDWLRRVVLPEARAGQADLLPETFAGLVAFIVPGTDRFSVHQGVSTPEPGGIEANATLPLILALDQVGPAPPPFTVLSEFVAFVLNNVAQVVHPEVSGPFAAPFANLIFAEKAAVFALLEEGVVDPALVPLAGALPQLVGFIAYSEVGVLDPIHGTLTGTPVGWTITGYDGIADGRSEFKGYYQNRRHAR